MQLAMPPGMGKNGTPIGMNPMGGASGGKSAAAKKAMLQVQMQWKLLWQRVLVKEEDLLEVVLHFLQAVLPHHLQFQACLLPIRRLSSKLFSKNMILHLLKFMLQQRKLTKWLNYNKKYKLFQDQNWHQSKNYWNNIKNFWLLKLLQALLLQLLPQHKNLRLKSKLFKLLKLPLQLLSLQLKNLNYSLNNCKMPAPDFLPNQHLLHPVESAPLPFKPC